MTFDVLFYNNFLSLNRDLKKSSFLMTHTRLRFCTFRIKIILNIVNFEINLIKIIKIIFDNLQLEN